MKTYYTEKFYDERIDSLNSARKIVPLVMDLTKPASVVDVGCGTGEFLHIFQEYGIEDITGLDGDWVSKEKLRFPEKHFKLANLEEPVQMGRTFDLVVSLEVGEHLPPKSAKTFVESLTGLGPVVLFSAAVPFQGGVHHVNEQWPEYWAGLFKERGFVGIDCLRKQIWQDEEVCFWYAQNIFLYVKEDYLSQHPLLQQAYIQSGEQITAMVHPRLFLPLAHKHKKLGQVVPAPIRRFFAKLLR